MAGETLTGEKPDWRTLPARILETDGFKGFATVLPVILLYLLVSIIPISFAIYASFYEIPLLSPTWEFVGVQNYLEVFQLNDFWASLWRGIVYMVGSTLVQLVVGLWLALALNRIARGQRFFTAIVFTAYLIPTIIVSLIALFMLDTNFGVLHMVFGEWIGLWPADSFGLGTRTWAMPLVVLIGAWKFSVFITIFALAQLRSIPDRFYEAAKIAGANRWQMFRDITLPRIKGVIAVAVLLRSIFMFNKFDIFWMLTEGGPSQSTTTLPVFAYRETFIAGKFGLGNAMAVVMFVFLAAGAVVYFKSFNPSEEVET